MSCGFWKIYIHNNTLLSVFLQYLFVSQKPSSLLNSKCPPASPFVEPHKALGRFRFYMAQ